jgi:hypothetical protein
LLFYVPGNLLLGANHLVNPDTYVKTKNVSRIYKLDARQTVSVKEDVVVSMQELRIPIAPCVERMTIVQITRFVLILENRIQRV